MSRMSHASSTLVKSPPSNSNHQRVSVSVVACPELGPTLLTRGWIAHARRLLADFHNWASRSQAALR
jgi:hypothetical protein